MRRHEMMLVWISAVCLCPRSSVRGELDVAARGEGGFFIRGDADSNGRVEISDAIFSLGYLFIGGVESHCLDAMDSNDNGALNITDPIAILSYLFLGARAVPEPFPDAGVDPTSDPFFCDNGRFAGLRRDVFGPTCALSSCHSKTDAQGGLVLEGEAAYSQLVGVLAQNDAARKAGLFRVKPGHPEESFLLKKITGELGPEHGERMPRAGTPLGSDTIERVRLWISDGALPSAPQDITLLPPSRGEQVLLPHFSVSPGEEVQRNYYVKLKNSEPLFVDRIEAIYAPGSVHRNIYTSDGVSRPDGFFEDTFQGIPFAYWGLRASGAENRLDWRLPSGVAIRLSPFQQTLLQTHFANIGPRGLPIGGCACINLHAAEAAEGYVPLGTMFLQNKNVILPPHSETTWDFGATFTRFRWNETVKLAGVASHFHGRGRSMEVRLWDGLNKNDDGSPRSGEFERMGVEKRVGFSDGGAAPPFVSFENDGPSLERGWGIVYRTVFVNETERVIPFGPYAETEEHANVLLFFYPGPENGETFSFPLPVQQ